MDVGTVYATAIRANKSEVKKSEGMQKMETGTLIDDTSVTASYAAADGTLWFGTEKGLVALSDGKFYEYDGDILDSAKINRIICSFPWGIEHIGEFKRN